MDYLGTLPIILALHYSVDIGRLHCSARYPSTVG